MRAHNPPPPIAGAAVDALAVEEGRSSPVDPAPKPSGPA
jgi:hypothetical protein